MSSATLDLQRRRFPGLSDREDDLAGIVSARLRRSGYFSLQNVRCSSRENVVELSGKVRSFYLKQLAQELAAHTVGVWHVVNHLSVCGPQTLKVAVDS